MLAAREQSGFSVLPSGKGMMLCSQLPATRRVMVSQADALASSLANA